jgi:hypothetical protein
MLKFQAQVYRINDIVGWHDRRELVLSPEFQRRRVWSPHGRSYLLDSIIRGMPLPQFFIREKVLLREKRTVREVVDGQQRLTTILDFLSGKITILPIHNTEYARTTFDNLPEATQRELLSFPLSFNILEGTDDADVLEIFSRLNAYTVPLNRQELLNARYVGAFKRHLDELSKRHLAYWQRHGILSNSAIARMRDVEFTAELVAAMLGGLQNQKRIVAELYARYDSEFPQASYIEPRFAETLELSEQLLNGNISATEFSKISLFYSLFAATYDLMYGLGSTEHATRTPLSPTGFTDAQQGLLRLNEALTTDTRPAEYAPFFSAIQQSTDKIQQRLVRHDILREILVAAFH